MDSILVMDLGSSSLRASLVTTHFQIVDSRSATLHVTRDGAAMVSFDPMEMLDAARSLLTDLAAIHHFDAIAITNQRASAVAFSRREPRAIGLGISWEDLRTASQCLALNRSGHAFAPNESATKFTWLIDRYRSDNPDLIVGTLDTWLTFGLTNGQALATDATNAAMTGLVDATGMSWDQTKLDVVGLTISDLAPIVDVVSERGFVDTAHGSVPIIVTIADQQASLAGQRSSAKVTLGTSAVADIDLESPQPLFERRGPCGTFPIITSTSAHRATFGVEAFWMNAGSAIAWLVHNGLVTDATATSSLAEHARINAIPTVVPAHSGLGAPIWDFGGRCTITELSSHAGAPEIVHGFLLGIACAARDLIRAIISDSGISPTVIGLDGKVATNRIVAAALAALTPQTLVLSPTPEATTLGAARLAFGASKEELPEGRPVQPTDRAFMETYWDRYHRSLELARGALPALSKVTF